MLGRYKIYRGSRPADDPLPRGVRQDTRRHTHHCLRPEARMVALYLADPNTAGWRRFSSAYLELIERRFARDRTPFDELARLAAGEDVFLGCSCPTKKNPDVRRCHTVLALGFMRSGYRKLRVVVPDRVARARG